MGFSLETMIADLREILKGQKTPACVEALDYIEYSENYAKECGVITK